MDKALSSANRLIEELSDLIIEAKKSAVKSINTAQTLLYWQIGRRINQEVLKGERAEYGKKIVVSLAQRLTVDFGSGFSKASLSRMMKFAELYQDSLIVASLVHQLSWTHITMLIPLKDELQREFYIQMCRLEGWSVRKLRDRINSMLFERTAISKKPEELIRRELDSLAEREQLSPSLVLKDPYLLNFLDLEDTFSERDLEQAILRELERFILELGSGFTFVERQKRMTIDEEDHYLESCRPWG